MPVGVSICYADGHLWQSGLGHDSLTPADWKSALAETLRGAATPTRRKRPVCVTVWFSDHSSLQYGLPAGETPAARGADDVSECKHDILNILHEKNERLTTSKILQEMQARDLLWGESTVKRALAGMVREHELNNRSGVRPRGYGLPAWH
jgi:hypothetical protein